MSNILSIKPMFVKVMRVIILNLIIENKRSTPPMFQLVSICIYLFIYEINVKGIKLSLFCSVLAIDLKTVTFKKFSEIFKE